jgi:hypothetical protein
MSRRINVYPAGQNSKIEFSLNVYPAGQNSKIEFSLFPFDTLFMLC